MSRSRNSRRGKKRSPRTHSPAPKNIGNSYKPIDSWCTTGLTARLTVKKQINTENILLKKEVMYENNLERYVKMNTLSY